MIAPLRKIVEYRAMIPPRAPKGTTSELVFEVLECGHAQLPRTDIIGETNAVRRRCNACKRGFPVDVR